MRAWEKFHAILIAFFSVSPDQGIVQGLRVRQMKLFAEKIIHKTRVPHKYCAPLMKRIYIP